MNTPRFVLHAAVLGALVSAGEARAGEPAPIVPLSAEVPAVLPASATEPVLATAFDACPTPQRHFNFGVGTIFMQARFDNNMAYGVHRTSNGGGGPAGTGFTQRVEIDRGVVAVPEIWLGYMNDEGIGARVRYWYFHEGTSQTANDPNSTQLYSAAPLGLGLTNGTDTMVATSTLNVQVLDLEGQYALRPAKWNFLFSGGLRLGRIDQSYDAFVPQSGNNAILSSNTFNGLGPTVAIEARHPLCCPCLSVYGSVRGSMIYGDSEQNAAVPDQNVFATDRRLASIGIGELELGLELNKNVGRSRLVGQVAVVAQNWSGAGSASRSSVNVLPGGGFVGASYVGDSDINFLGVAVRLGVNY